METLKYQTGFASHFETEAVPGTLPHGQNSPQKVAYGLYAEQLSGSSFLAPRHENLRTWTYRIRPSVVHGKFEPMPPARVRTAPCDEGPLSPNQLRWNPLAYPDKPTDFIDGLVTVATNGDVAAFKGCSVHLYAATASMTKRYFYCADGEFLFVPQDGAIGLDTELGSLDVVPGEVAVVPRGVKFRVRVPAGKARGYVCENYGPALRLPYLGPIGSNGLAQPRDFLYPVARFENLAEKSELVAKLQGGFWRAPLDHSPLDVVAWHGNYAPYKYDLARFNTVNTVSFDHPDPSIFTVLTSPSEHPGTSNMDFVIFPPRWMVAEHSFRPPYFHRNVMSEYMGLVKGAYDAKTKGFLPGGGSLHNCMSPHGPDLETFAKASEVDLKPHKIVNTLAFMFESCLVFRPTRFALEGGLLQDDYQSYWQGLQNHFSPPK